MALLYHSYSAGMEHKHTIKENRQKKNAAPWWSCIISRFPTGWRLVWSASERRSRTTITWLLETAKLMIHTLKFLKVDDSWWLRAVGSDWMCIRPICADLIGDLPLKPYQQCFCLRETEDIVWWYWYSRDPKDEIQNRGLIHFANRLGRSSVVRCEGNSG